MGTCRNGLNPPPPLHSFYRSGEWQMGSTPSPPLCLQFFRFFTCFLLGRHTHNFFSGQIPKPISKKMYEKKCTRRGLGIGGGYLDLIGSTTKKILSFFVCLPLSEYIAAINSPTHSIHLLLNVNYRGIHKYRDLKVVFIGKYKYRKSKNSYGNRFRLYYFRRK